MGTYILLGLIAWHVANFELATGSPFEGSASNSTKTINIFGLKTFKDIHGNRTNKLDHLPADVPYPIVNDFVQNAVIEFNGKGVKDEAVFEGTFAPEEHPSSMWVSHSFVGPDMKNDGAVFIPGSIKDLRFYATPSGSSRVRIAQSHQRSQLFSERLQKRSAYPSVEDCWAEDDMEEPEDETDENSSPESEYETDENSTVDPEDVTDENPSEDSEYETDENSSLDPQDATDENLPEKSEEDTNEKTVALPEIDDVRAKKMIQEARTELENVRLPDNHHYKPNNQGRKKPGPDKRRIKKIKKIKRFKLPKPPKPPKLPKFPKISLG